MRLTPPRQTRTPSRRRGGAALLAGLAAFAMTFTDVPAALAAPAAAVAPAVVDEVQDETAPITFDDVRLLIQQFEATGEVTFAGARRLEFVLLFAERNVERGTPEGAIDNLEVFKRQASNPRYVPSESARDQLIAAADQLIAQLTPA